MAKATVRGGYSEGVRVTTRVELPSGSHRWANLREQLRLPRVGVEVHLGGRSSRLLKTASLYSDFRLGYADFQRNFAIATKNKRAAPGMGSEGESGGWREQTEPGIIPEFSESREYTIIDSRNLSAESI